MQAVSGPQRQYIRLCDLSNDKSVHVVSGRQLMHLCPVFQFTVCLICISHQHTKFSETYIKRRFSKT